MKLNSRMSAGSAKKNKKSKSLLLKKTALVRSKTSKIFDFNSKCKEADLQLEEVQQRNVGNALISFEKAFSA